MSIVIIGATFVDIKGYPFGTYLPTGRNEGRVEQVHGGVCRNIAEDLGNAGLHPVFVSLVDGSATGKEVLDRLEKHGVDTGYMRSVPNGHGTWLAIFGNDGDLAGSISKRPDLMPILDILEEQGDEIFSRADSVCMEIDIEQEIAQKVFELAQKHQKAVYAAVSNITIAVTRRNRLQDCACFVCNSLEAGLLFGEDYSRLRPQELEEVLVDRISSANISRMVVTMGSLGAVYADRFGCRGVIEPRHVDVLDTTGAGDAFFAGVAMGLTYGKTLREACVIGTRLAASVICTGENVCPPFLPSEFGIDPAAADVGTQEKGGRR